MTKELDRRQLLTTVGGALAAAAAGTVGKAVHAQADRPTGEKDALPAAAARNRSRRRPLAIGSANCLNSKSATGATVMAEALARLDRGERPLEAIVSGVAICELDGEDSSVGYGGLPNADGVVQLDAAVMEASTRRAGGVGALEGVRNPARVALAVADRTDHHLLVGAGAQAFARQMGFAIEADLNTEKSRRAWLEWKQQLDPLHWLDPERQASAAARARNDMVARGWLDSLHL